MKTDKRQVEAYNRAVSLQGLTEIVGPIHNEAIIQFYDDVGHSWVQDDETPWCAAFVGSCLERSGLTSTRDLAARSYLEWGVNSSDNPRVMDIVIFSRGDKPWLGHVGFLAKPYKKGDRSVYVLGGNQNNRVSVAKYPAEKLLGFRRMEAEPWWKNLFRK